MPDCEVCSRAVATEFFDDDGGRWAVCQSCYLAYLTRISHEGGQDATG
jgi:ribosome-binding protein aMBF1 (putative translation factor)